MKAFTLLVLFTVSCSNPIETKGLNFNNYRKQNNGIELRYYHENKWVSTDESKINGVSYFFVPSFWEKSIRKKGFPYLQSKFIHFDSKGIILEKNILRKPINDSVEWFMNTTDYYRKGNISGFIVLNVNGKHNRKEEIKIDKQFRDSVLKFWNIN